MSAEPDGSSYVFQGFIQGKDYGQFGLQRLGNSCFKVFLTAPNNNCLSYKSTTKAVTVRKVWQSVCMSLINWSWRFECRHCSNWFRLAADTKAAYQTWKGWTPSTCIFWRISYPTANGRSSTKAKQREMIILQHVGLYLKWLRWGMPIICCLPASLLQISQLKLLTTLRAALQPFFLTMNKMCFFFF